MGRRAVRRCRGAGNAAARSRSRFGHRRHVRRPRQQRAGCRRIASGRIEVDRAERPGDRVHRCRSDGRRGVDRVRSTPARRRGRGSPAPAAARACPGRAAIRQAVSVNVSAASRTSAPRIDRGPAQRRTVRGDVAASVKRHRDRRSDARCRSPGGTRRAPSSGSAPSSWRSQKSQVSQLGSGPLGQQPRPLPVGGVFARRAGLRPARAACQPVSSSPSTIVPGRRVHGQHVRGEQQQPGRRRRAATPPRASATRCSGRGGPPRPRLLRRPRRRARR